MARKRTARSSALSLRSALIVSAVGVLTVGMAQIGGTMAASSDTATARSGTLAAARNFWPTPLVPDSFTQASSGDPIAVPCRTVGNSAIINWASVPTATEYKVMLVKGTVPLSTPTTSIPPGVNGLIYTWTVPKGGTLQVSNILLGEQKKNDKFWLRVHTVNGPRMSTGWAGAQIYRPNGDNNNSECTDLYTKQANADNWENYYDSPGDIQGFSQTESYGLMGRGLDLQALEESGSEDVPSTTEETTTPTNSAEESSSSVKASPSSSSKNPSGTPSSTPPTTPSGTSPTTPSGTPSSTPPKAPSGTPSSTPPTTPSGTSPTTPSGTPSSTPPKAPSGTSPTTPSGTPSGTPSDAPITTPPVVEKPGLIGKATGGPAGVTAGTSANGKNAILVDGSGDLIVQGAIEPGSPLKWVDGELWIIGESQVSRISVASDGKWKFYENGGTPPASLSGD